MFGSRHLLALALLTVACAGDDESTTTMAASAATSDGETGIPSAETMSDDGADDTTSADAATEEDSESSSGGATEDDAEGTAVDGCETIDPDQPWLADYTDEVVRRLTGMEEALPGVTLGVRESLAERTATGDYLLAEFAALGLDATEHAYSATGRNVYATLAATDGGEAIHVLGAHFDTVPQSPGANDNATGVALVLATARYLRDVPCRSANVIFVLFDEEEIGLVGSDAFAAFLDAQQLPIASVHTIDQMGWDADGDRTVELERADEGLFEGYAQAVQAYDLSVPLTPTNTGFTDHVSFRAYGFDAVGLTEEFVSGDTTPHYHQPSDTYPTVDLAYLQSTAVLLHAMFADIVG